MDREAVIAWVESPLQLVGAAEWADAHSRVVPVAGRLTAQMPETSDELIARGARFGRTEPYLGIPWQLLSAHGHWLVGDGFSGQFRLAAAVLRPHRITFLDDGALTPSLVDGLLGEHPYERPHVSERRMSTLAAPLARDVVLRRAFAGRASFFTAFDLGPRRADLLADRGFGIRRHTFGWTRGAAPQAATLGPRIVLGSALPVDGRMPLKAYLRWIERIADHGPVVYLPHRRETADQLRAVDTIPDVDITPLPIPVELALAGSPIPLEIHTQPSSTTTTLALVLAGTGSTLHSPRSTDRRGVTA